MAEKDNIAFSVRQQQAVFGHALVGPELWDQLEQFGVSKSWIADAALQELWDHIARFRKYYARPPGPEELVEFVAAKDPDLRPAMSRQVTACITSANDIALDILTKNLSSWAKSRVIADKITNIAKLYNAGEHEAAAKLYEQGSVDLERIRSMSGTKPDKMEDAIIRFDGEAARRLEDANNLTPYGVTFLDDCLGGIIPNDLVLFGARTSVGKTELLKIIAQHNAKQKRRVAFFALEAEEAEIERRIKFGLLGRRLRGDEQSLAGFNYADWRMGRLEKRLAKFSKSVEEEFHDTYNTLKTYYRIKNDFGLPDLDREVLKIFDETELIIIDHLQYFDSDGKNENHDMKMLVKKLRHLALGLGKPILAISHLRKDSGQTLAPGLDDFHGSSDITKIATTAIMLAPAWGFSAGDIRANGSPTFIRIVKNRLGSDRVATTGVAFYDRAEGTYTPYYALGRFNAHDTLWKAQKENFPIWADGHHLLKSANDVTEG